MMHVWNANAKNPCDVRKSIIPLQSGVSKASPEYLVLEQEEHTLTGSTANFGRGGTKKKANDSVSHSNYYFTARDNTFQ